MTRRRLRRAAASWAIALAAVLSLPVATPAAQPATPYAKGDPQKGHAIVDKDCNGCHAQQFGDKDRIYTRADRRVKTPAQLRAQVAYCNTQLGSGYFPEEEDDVAAWLDQRYYHFGR